MEKVKGTIPETIGQFQKHEWDPGITVIYIWLTFRKLWRTIAGRKRGL